MSGKELAAPGWRLDVSATTYMSIVANPEHAAPVGDAITKLVQAAR